jgi:hypothetical protein
VSAGSNGPKRPGAYESIPTTVIGPNPTPQRLIDLTRQGARRAPVITRAIAPPRQPAGGAPLKFVL